MTLWKSQIPVPCPQTPVPCLQIHGVRGVRTLALLTALTLGGREGSTAPGAGCAAPNLPAPDVVQQTRTINPGNCPRIKN